MKMQQQKEQEKKKTKKQSSEHQQGLEMKKKKSTYLQRDILPSSSSYSRNGQQAAEKRGTLTAKVSDFGIGPIKSSYLKVTNSAVGERKNSVISIPMVGLGEVVKLVNKYVDNIDRFQKAIKRAMENDTMSQLVINENFYRWNPYNETADVHIWQEAVIGEKGVATIYVTLIFILFDRKEDRFLTDPEPVISIGKYPGSQDWERSVDIQGLDDLRLLQQLLSLFHDDTWDEEDFVSSSEKDDGDDDVAEIQDSNQIGGRAATAIGRIDIDQPGTSSEKDLIMLEDPEASVAKKGKRIVYKRVQPYEKHEKKQQQKMKKL
jgi:hypothetical protein